MTPCHCTGLPAVLNRRQSTQNLSPRDTSLLHNSGSPLLGPSVRHLLESYGLETYLIQPSGHKGQLLKGDVLKYIHEHAKIKRNFTLDEKTEKYPSSEWQPPIQDIDAEYTDFGLNNTRLNLAKMITESKNMIPHTYTTIDCNMENILNLCKKLKENNMMVTVNDFIIRAAGLTLRRIPEVNSYWSHDGPVQLGTINIAVEMTSPNGLVTPVLNGVDELDVLSISSAVRELSNLVTEGKFPQVQGGSFTVSNLGMFGVKSFTAVIYPQQTGVLAVGESQVSVVNNEKLAQIMTVTLCCDGRVVDEPLASRWLKEFQELIENPMQMGL